MSQVQARQVKVFWARAPDRKFRVKRWMSQPTEPSSAQYPET